MIVNSSTSYGIPDIYKPCDGIPVREGKDGRCLKCGLLILGIGELCEENSVGGV